MTTTRMHNVHFSFFILQLSDLSTFSECQDEKKLGCTMCIRAFSSFSSLLSALKDEKARMHTVHLSFFILLLTEFSVEG